MRGERRDGRVAAVLGAQHHRFESTAREAFKEGEAQAGAACGQAGRGGRRSTGAARRRVCGERGRGIGGVGGGEAGGRRGERWRQLHRVADCDEALAAQPVEREEGGRLGELAALVQQHKVKLEPLHARQPSGGACGAHDGELVQRPCARGHAPAVDERDGLLQCVLLGRRRRAELARELALGRLLFGGAQLPMR